MTTAKNGGITAIPKTEVRAPLNEKDDLIGFIPDFNYSCSADEDYRNAALRVDLGIVEVHHVGWVKVNSTRFAVTRHRYEKRNWKF
jgi:hypothetical protein